MFKFPYLAPHTKALIVSKRDARNALSSVGYQGKSRFLEGVLWLWRVAALGAKGGARTVNGPGSPRISAAGVPNTDPTQYVTETLRLEGALSCLASAIACLDGCLAFCLLHLVRTNVLIRSRLEIDSCAFVEGIEKEAAKAAKQAERDAKAAVREQGPKSESFTVRKKERKTDGVREANLRKPKSAGRQATFEYVGRKSHTVH